MEYQNMLTALENLRKLVSEYYIYDEYGDQPKLYEDDIASLKEEYNKVFDLASTYLQSVSDDKVESERANMENADRIQERLQKDMHALEELKPGMTLVSAMKYVNNKVVNVTGKKFKDVGDQCSSRQMMTITGSDGKPLRGFFTERTYMGFNPANAGYFVEKATRVHPEFAAMFEYAIPMAFKGQEFSRFSNEQLADIANRFGKMEGYNNALNYLQNFLFQVSRGDYITRENLDEDSPVAPFDTRNIVFSNITHLLGMDDKIAKSTPLTIRNNGKDIQGCFMEFAEGEDPSHPKHDGGFTKFNSKSVDNSPALKTLSDIQVLDYICGNVDRHGRNVFYKFDNNGKVIDFMGIDNDLAFGHMDENFSKAINGGLKAIYHMSKSMCDTVMRLDEHSLIHAFDGQQLEKENIDYTIRRFRALKDKINEGKVLIIDDKDYEKYQLSDFLGEPGKDFSYKDKTVQLETKVSIYKNIDDFRATLDRMSQYDRERHFNKDREAQQNGKPEPQNNSKDQLEIAEEKNINVENLEMGEDAPAITDLKNKLSRADRFVFGGSVQFKKAMQELDRLNEATNIIGKDETKLTASNVRAIELGYKKLLSSCTEYLNFKKEQGKLDVDPSSRTGRRIAAIKDVAQFCKGRINTLELAIENTIDKGKLEKADVHEMKNEAQRLMIEGLQPKQIGDYMKDLISMHAEKPDEKQTTVKLGQQMNMCMEYIKEKNLPIEEYGINREDIEKSKALLKDSRIANAELKNDKPEEIRDLSSKANIMI